MPLNALYFAGTFSLYLNSSPVDVTAINQSQRIVFIVSELLLRFFLFVFLFLAYLQNRIGQGYQFLRLPFALFIPLNLRLDLKET